MVALVVPLVVPLADERISEGIVTPRLAQEAVASSSISVGGVSVEK